MVAAPELARVVPVRWALTAQQAPGRLAIDGFMKELARHGTNATYRETRGQEIDAACGQLRLRGLREKGTE